MKKMIALSTLGAALATVGSVLMLNGHNVKAVGDTPLAGTSDLYLEVEKSEELELISVPSYDFGKVTQSQIASGFDIVGQTPIATDNKLEVADMRVGPTDYKGWTLEANKTIFTDPTTSQPDLDQGGSLTLNNSNTGETLTLTGNPIDDVGGSVLVATNPISSTGTNPSFIALNPTGDLTHTGIGAIVDPTTVYEGTVAWTLATINTRQRSL